MCVCVLWRAGCSGAVRTQGVNGALLLGTPYAARVWGVVLAMAVGLLILALSSSFGVAIAGIMVAGAACSFGEGVMLGYLNLFDPLLVNACAPPRLCYWCSGCDEQSAAQAAHSRACGLWSVVVCGSCCMQGALGPVWREWGAACCTCSTWALGLTCAPGFWPRSRGWRRE